jgi:hypothetical protein
MLNQQNPFEIISGTYRFSRPGYLILLLGVTAIASGLIVKMGVIGAIAVILLPFIFGYVYLLFKYPVIGLFTTIAYGFFALGLGKYITGIPLGTLVDGFLVITYLALIFNKFYEKVDWSPANKDITFLALVWFGYSVFQIINPEAQSFAAWFSGRGISLYLLLMVPLTLILIDTNQKLNVFFYLWGAIAILATLKGIMQKELGVDQWERAWLNEGNYKTHILFGKLRVFSFLSDAGQFGANQAYTGVMATILTLAVKGLKQKIFFITVAVLSFYGMLISGTRGAISIPLMGFATFFVLRKNKAVMLSGFIFLLLVFYFFKFTSIGQGNYQIRRMRTAFDPNDASLQVRLDNQRKLKSYMASRPFGGGIGHGGVKAQRYLPNAYLSQVPTDSGYVLIWVEQGIVGLMLHLFILFYVIIKASYRIMFRIRDPITKLKMSAMVSGMVGIMVANYGNAVLYQMPTSLLFYASMALLMNMENFEKEQLAENEKTDQLLPLAAK